MFPHLVTLARPGYRIFEFAATQTEDEQVANLSGDLPEDVVLYVHTEQFQILCSGCWRDEDLDHERHTEESHRVVTGKLCAPPTLSDRDLREQLDVVSAETPARVFVPELSAAVGDDARAAVEGRRAAMLRGDAAL